MSRMIFLAALLVAAPAAAQLGDPVAAFASADSNHDGVVSRAEFVAARQARSAMLDRNGNGGLDRADAAVIARFRPEAAATIDALLTAADTDHDGKVSRAELAAAPVPVFDRADANHDGVVASAEVDALRATATAGR